MLYLDISISSSYYYFLLLIKKKMSKKKKKIYHSLVLNLHVFQMPEFKLFCVRYCILNFVKILFLVLSFSLIDRSFSCLIP
jgi:hypothetical protein